MKNVGPIRHNEPSHANSPDVASGTVAHRLCIDVDDNANNDDDNDNAWQRGPLWPHGMGPNTKISLVLESVRKPWSQTLDVQCTKNRWWPGYIQAIAKASSSPNRTQECTVNDRKVRSDGRGKGMESIFTPPVIPLTSQPWLRLSLCLCILGYNSNLGHSSCFSTFLSDVTLSVVAC